jgi:hypothetical protein
MALLTNDSIVKLVKAGMSEEIVLNLVKTQPAKFELGVDEILALKTNGVSEKIIGAMIQAKTQAVVSNTEIAKPSESIESKNIKEPDYVGVFFRLNPTNGELIPLERQNTEMRTSRADIFVAVDTKRMAQIEGEKSPVRFKRGEKLDFIVKLNSQQNDPQSQIGFVLFESVKGKRQWVLAKGSASTLSANGSAGDISQNKMVPYNVAKYGESSFKISPVEQLLPGEYVLGIKGVPVSFCFGVDRDESASSKSANATNRISDPAVEKLCEMLDQDNVGKVKDALKKLRNMKATEAAPRILPCLAHSNPDVIREACRTLVVIGNQDAVPAIIPLLTNEKPDIIREACRTIAIIGNKDAIPAIEPLLTNSRSDIREEARKAITKLRAGH